MSRPTVLCIVGPTASGKTALSVALAQRLNGEIVSADAVAVYKGLDIGSAKPTVEEQKDIPHHMLDCAEITDSDYTVSVFREQARNAIDAINANNRLPIVVGGSGLYHDAIFGDMRFSAPSDPVLRSKLEQEYDRDPTKLFERLREDDPITAERLHPNDKKRVVRATEVLMLTGKPFSKLNRSFQTAQEEVDSYRIVRIGLTMNREILYQRIDQRVDRMIESGLVQEAYSLFDRGFTPERYKAMQAIGYAQLYESYQGRCTIPEAVEQIKLSTRHFAKRQITWFKRNHETRWFDIINTDQETLIRTVTEILNEYRSNDC